MSGSPPALHPSPLTLAVLSRAASSLVGSVQYCAEKGNFGPLIRGIAEAVEAVGISVDRVQLPVSKQTGFRHPVYSAVVATWARGKEIQVVRRLHQEDIDQPDVDFRALIRPTPYYALVFEGRDFVRQDLTAAVLPELPIYADLAEQGYVDYIALALPMPDGDIQSLSFAARTPMPLDAPLRLMALRPTLALAVYGAYAASSARQLATTYIGRVSGLEVLAGEIHRGHTRQQEAGILFTDLRGFTAMTRQIGAAPTVAVLNRVFETVGEVVEQYGGEILKFIGDAMLVIFPITEEHPRAEVAEALVAVAREGLAAIAALPQEERPLQVGFGGHIGGVQLGNIGTASRLDFTVIGPAVNLASRLEGLCSTLTEAAVFSQEVAAEVELRPLGSQAVKGLDEPVAVFGLAP